MRKFAVVLPFLFLVAGCGEKAKAGATETTPAVGAAKDLLGKASDLVQKAANLDQVKTTFGDLGKTLQGITDGASAEQAKAKLGDYVKTLQGQLGDGTIAKWTSSLGSTGEGLVKQVVDQANRLAANPDVQKAIGPVLEQVKALFAK
ncbi:MAG: hypothetical protein JNK15_05075 [Planctomycetes bacterium]|nr:hypothetical protein [Planctomycetota bacterium]